MKRIGANIFALACMAGLCLPCVAQDNPWNGSWKEVPGSMTYDGPNVSIATDATGYTVTQDGKARPPVVCDGQPHPSENGLKISCTKGDGVYHLTNWSKDGKVAAKGTTTFSADGKVMTRKIEIFPADGSSSYELTTTSKRISGGPGLDGVWKEQSFSESQDTGILGIEVNGDSVSFKETDIAKPVVSKLDGTPTKISDTRTVAVTMDGSHTLKVTYRGDGKVQRENTFVLSPDGKSLKETDVTPEPSPSTMTLMFHKS